MALDRTLFDFHNRTKLAFVNALRFAFKNAPTPDIYKYDNDQRKSQISIYRDFPRREQKYPMLLVSAESGDISVVAFGQEEMVEIFDPVDSNTVKEFEVTGTFTIPIRIRILAQSTTDRERLADLVHLFVRFLFRNRLHSERIAYTKIRTMGETTSKLPDDTVVYENGVIVDVYGEIKQIFDMTLFETIDRIDLFVDDTEKVTQHRVGANP